NAPMPTLSMDCLAGESWRVTVRPARPPITMPSALRTVPNMSAAVFKKFPVTGGTEAFREESSKSKVVDGRWSVVSSPWFVMHDRAGSGEWALEQLTTDH